MDSTKQQQLYNQIYQTLRKNIVDGDLRIGQPVSERSLASYFHSSRTPIRRALQQLVNDGLLQKNKQRGYHVSIATLEDLREVYNIRISLESLACYQAALKMSEKQFVELEKMNYEACQIIEHNGDPKMLYQLQKKFLAKINEFSHMRRLHMLQDLVDDYLLHYDNVFFSKILPECSDIVRINSQLVEVMRKQDKEQIEETIEQRYSVSYNYLSRNLGKIANGNLEATKD